jgi:hypothetical protein
MPLIEVNHVTKGYQLGQIQSLKTTVLNQWRRHSTLGYKSPAQFPQDWFSAQHNEKTGNMKHTRW